MVELFGDRTQTKSEDYEAGHHEVGSGDQSPVLVRLLFANGWTK